MVSGTAGEINNTIVESTEEYKYVERLIPPTKIPTPRKHDGPAPSGWIPPSGRIVAINFLQTSVNYMCVCVRARPGLYTKISDLITFISLPDMA